MYVQPAAVIQCSQTKTVLHIELEGDIYSPKYITEHRHRKIAEVSACKKIAGVSSCHCLSMLTKDNSLKIR